MNLTAWIDRLTWLVTAATIARIALHWARGLFELWIAPASSFWSFYAKLELTIAYVSGSLAAFGRKQPTSEPSAPVARSLNPAEGKLQ